MSKANEPTSKVTPQYGVPHDFQTKGRLGTAMIVMLMIAMLLFVLAMWGYMLHHIRAIFAEASVWLGVAYVLIPWAAAGILHGLVAYGTAYRFEADGLYQKRPFCRERCIPWTEFQQICICNVRAGRYQAFLNGLFFVRRGGKPYRFRYVPEVLDGRLGLGRRGVINLVYTPELHAGLAERCPLPIEDLRSTHK